jgi:hypothetical protein
LQKLQAFIRSKQEVDDIPVEKTNFVLYHLEDIESSSSAIDVTFNNVKVFASAIHKNEFEVYADQNAFYWINVVALSFNPLADLFPIQYPNVALVYWEIDNGIMSSHIDTLRRIGPSISKSFSSVFFMNSGVRGPFTSRNNGAWMSAYKSMLSANNVGVASATLSCFPKPHIQTHFFAIRSELVTNILAAVKDVYLNMENWITMDDYFQNEMMDIAKSAGYNIASKLHNERLGTSFFQGACINSSITRDHNDHVFSMKQWCHVSPSEVNFVRWSGESLGARGYLCNKAISTDVDSVSTMETEMALVARAEPELHLDVSEALTGGQLFDLYQSFNKDFWRHRNEANAVANVTNSLINSMSDKDNAVVDFSTAETAADEDHSPKVCFLIRTSKSHDPLATANSNVKYGFLPIDIEGNIKSKSLFLVCI